MMDYGGNGKSPRRSNDMKEAQNPGHGIFSAGAERERRIIEAGGRTG